MKLQKNRKQIVLIKHDGIFSGVLFTLSFKWLTDLIIL